MQANKVLHEGLSVSVRRAGCTTLAAVVSLAFTVNERVSTQTALQRLGMFGLRERV
jgi:hypothetical protein